MSAVLDPALPALAVVLDAERLSALFGEPLRADYLRYKAGHSVVARIRFGDGHLGWLAGYHPDQDAKTAKLAERAERGQRAGQSAGRHRVLRTVPVPGPDGGAGHRLVLGPLSQDRRLRGPLRVLRLRKRTGVRVLNYIPHRRLVVALEAPDAGRIVAKITAEPSRAAVPLLAGLRGAGVPVLEWTQPASLPASALIAYYPWFGTGDLGRLYLETADRGTADRTRALRLARRAGQALARLHAVGLDAAFPPGSGAGPQKRYQHRFPGAEALPQGGDAVAGAADKLRTVVEETAGLVPELGGRLAAAADRIASRLTAPAGGEVFLHGDFSADQVLVQDDDIRLADLDRWDCGPAASDLGCFAAVELLTTGTGARGPLTEALLDGYGMSTGAAVPDEEKLAIWTSFHLLARIQDPFRDCRPDWPAGIAGRLDQVEAVLR